jgi:hypothetical protein
MLRDEGRARPDFVRALFEITKGMRLATEPVAIRGSRLALTRDTYRDIEDVDRPITGEHLTLTEVDAVGLVHISVLFDPDDIDGAFAELTARWIALGEFAHPDVIVAAHELFEDTNRHDWDALATREAGATYVNHRQLAVGQSETIVDHWSSLRTMGSMIPDMWVELAEILTHSAAGLVTYIVVKGTTTGGLAIELPAVILLLIDGDHLRHMEAFDPDQRDLALARFEELGQA